MGVFFQGELTDKINEFRDRRADRLDKRGLRFQVSHYDDEAQKSDNGWVTIKGTHVLIDKDGNIQNGPGGLKEKRFKHATSTHFGKSASQAAKEKYESQNQEAGMVGEVKDWADEYFQTEDYEGVKKVEKKAIDKLNGMNPGDKFVYNGYEYEKLPNGKFKSPYSSFEFTSEEAAPMVINYLSQATYGANEVGKYDIPEGISLKFVEGSQSAHSQESGESAENSEYDKDIWSIVNESVHNIVEEYTNYIEAEQEIAAEIDNLPVGTQIHLSDFEIKKIGEGQFEVENLFSGVKYEDSSKEAAILIYNGVSEDNSILIESGNEEDKIKEEEKPVQKNKFMELMSGLNSENFKEHKEEIVQEIEKLPVGTKVQYNSIELLKKPDGNYYVGDGPVAFNDKDIYGLAVNSFDSDTEFNVDVPEEAKSPVDSFSDLFNSVNGKSAYEIGEVKDEMLEKIAYFPEGAKVEYNGTKLTKGADGKFHTALNNPHDITFSNHEVVELAGNAALEGLPFNVQNSTEETNIEMSPESLNSQVNELINKNKENLEEIKSSVKDFVSSLPYGTKMELNNGYYTVEAEIKEDMYGDKGLFFGDDYHGLSMAGIKVKNGVKNGVENPIKIISVGETNAESENFETPEGEEHWALLGNGKELVNLETGEIINDMASLPDSDIVVGSLNGEDYNTSNYVSSKNYEQHKSNTNIGKIKSEMIKGNLDTDDATLEVAKELKNLPVGAKIKAAKKTYEKVGDMDYKDQDGKSMKPQFVCTDILSDAYISDDYKEHVVYPGNDSESGNETLTKESGNKKISKILQSGKAKDDYDSMMQIDSVLKDLPVGSVVNTGISEYVKQPEGDFKNKETKNKHSSGIISKYISGMSSANEFIKSIGDGTIYQAPTVNFGEPVTNTGKPAKKTEFKESKTKAGLKKIKVDESQYTQERKDSAFWDKESQGREADNFMREYTGQIWKSAPKETKSAVNSYTGSGYQTMNDALRNGSYNPGGDSYMDEKIDRVAELIDQSSYDRDIWVQRGISMKSAASLLGISKDELSNLKGSWSTNDEQLKQNSQILFDKLKDKRLVDNAFQSCGSAKGTGFDDKPVLMNIYCPAGTKMLYVEPFSSCGNGAGINWDGESSQSNIGGEAETILQRGTVYRPTKVSIKNGKIYMDVEVIDQGHYIRNKKD